MANKKNITEIMREKKVTLEILEELMKELSRLEEYRFTESIEDGEEQATNYCTGELYWKDSEGKRTTENTGVPYMKTKWKTIVKPESKYDDEDKAYRAALETIRNTLCDLV